MTLIVGGRTYRHDAYALGMMAPETDPDRQGLAAFVTTLDSLAAEGFGARHFAPDRYAIRAALADPAPADSVVPSEVAWPESLGVKLADAADCQVVPAAAVGKLLADANQITRFVDGGVKYFLYVRPMLPGDTGC